MSAAFQPIVSIDNNGDGYTIDVDWFDSLIDFDTETGTDGSAEGTFLDARLALIRRTISGDPGNPLAVLVAPFFAIPAHHTAAMKGTTP